MKKSIISLAVLLFIVMTAFAQNGPISFGAKAGVNFSSILGDEVDDFDGRTSIHFGAVVKIGVSDVFAVQPELLYSTQGATWSIAGVDSTFKLDYLNVPIMADFTVVEGFSLQAGPQIGINITSEVDIDGETEELEDIESLDMGLGIGAQYTSPMGLFFQARYMVGLSDIVDDGDFKNQNSVLSISAGWFFN